MTSDCQDEKHLPARIVYPIDRHRVAALNEAVDLMLGNLNLMDNLLRGTFAEALVATATGGELQPEWTSWDISLDHPEASRVKVEVKCSGHFQSWPQESKSPTKWDIMPRDYGAFPDGTAFTVEDPPQRISDLYVFALHRCTDPLHLDHWSFWVVPTSTLDRCFGLQKSVTSGSLCARVPGQVHRGLTIDKMRHAVDDFCRGNPPLSPTSNY